MLDAYRIQAKAGPVTDKALEEIVFRAEHGVVQSLAPYPRAQRVALLPSVVRMLLTTFLEELAGPGGLSGPHESAAGTGEGASAAREEGAEAAWVDPVRRVLRSRWPSPP
jgi:hypothetical protein